MIDITNEIRDILDTFCCAHCYVRVVTNNNKANQSGTVTKVGNAQSVAASYKELQTHGTKLLVRVPKRGRIGTC